MKHAIAGLLSLCLCTTPAAGQSLQLEVVPLQYRTLEDILPVLRPLLARGGNLTGSNNQLIIKSTPANITELKRVLAGLDQPLRRLRISVSQGTGNRRTTAGGSLSGSYAPDGENGVKLRAVQDEDNASMGSSYSVQTVEGSPAFIRSGRLLPITERTTVSSGGRIVQQETTRYRDTGSGFYVLPRVNGDRVTLLISSRMSEPGLRGDDRIREAGTTVSGRLGEWLPVAGINQSGSSTRRGLTGGGQGSHNTAYGLMLKVEAIEARP